ncbi:MAG TPA: histidine phosphatase family protein [Clostridia bacterium]|nr:histidine phosphatase family protein [Clostridia bacterium]
MKAYHIYLLRHGETQGNREGRYVGRTDLPVSEEGRKRLGELAAHNRYPDAEEIYSSPMERCVETLGMLYPGRKPEVIDDLRECDFGNYEGKTLEQLRDDPEYQKWASGASSAPPGGESSVAFQKRCCAAFEIIVESMMKTGRGSAVVMAHGGTIMSVLARYAFPRRNFYDWLCESGTGFEVLITPQLWMSGKALEVVGYVPESVEESGGASDEAAE